MQASNTNKPLIIGVSGGSGSGKTTIANKLIMELQDESIALIQMDSYYKKLDLPYEQRKKQNFDHPLSFDTDLLVEDLNKLKHLQSIEVPIYDFVDSNRTEQTKHQEPTDVILLEGILTLYDKRLRDLMDIKVFVDTDDDIRLIRRISRDVEERGYTLETVFSQYLDHVRPMYQQFIEPTKRFANLIVPEGGSNKVAIDLLTTKIKYLIQEKRNTN
ncbi:uridine kinase [Bombilactobacillus thymidiniphilus]|uniref:Uridine kinase n=1 Tax=Bombilactobacillus thymidiniphilus TaxID=2923363 RepID=A0ABY4PDM4_9LACO|nr:uridine kinase [Bombilactobacillus thymidiniphilus]UQS83382.1 uridine kinase [Bombilactobacillus thymidiniphilus]